MSRGGVATRTTEAYWVTRPGEGAVQRETLPSTLESGTSLLQARYTAVSPGTERLVGLGHVPASCADVMACRYMGGSFDLPVKYGYGFVGVGIEGDLAGRRAFVMHPHQGLAAVANEHVTLLPDELPSRRAALLPSLETALNAVWDADLADGERVLVVGAGPIGLLIAYLLRRLHGTAALLCEKDENQAVLADSLPWIDRVASPDELHPQDVDVAFHATGSSGGLNSALRSLDFEGRVIELSWYGEGSVTVDLGTHFHYLRQRIIASQVSSIAPTRRKTHAFEDRLQECIQLLDDPDLEKLLDPVVPFREMPSFMKEVYDGRFRGVLPVIAHGANEDRP